MNYLYAMTAELPNGSEVGTIAPNFWNYFYYLQFILVAVVFVIGLMFALKRIQNPNHKALKIVSFIIPVIGIILFFVNRKNDSEEATEYLKISLFGIITYVAMLIVFAICVYVRLFFATAG